MRRGKGFTLIELLVVIAIIAILAAILYPVFLSAKNRAKMAACQSNMKQLAHGMLLYSNDWDTTLPMAIWGYNSSDSSSPAAYWGWAIKKYCGSAYYLPYCPAQPAVKAGYNDRWFYYMTTVGMNIALGEEMGVSCLRATKVGEVVMPSQTIMLGDASMYMYKGYWPDAQKLGHWAIHPGANTEPKLGQLTWLNPMGWAYGYFDPNRHNGKVNIACIDGHVGAFDRKFLLTTHATDWRNPKFTWWDVDSSGTARRLW